MQDQPRTDELGRAHSSRFRKLGGMTFPRAVAETYESDLARAASDTDDEVLENVASYERERGLEAVDWKARGAEFRASKDGDEWSNVE